MTDQPGLIERIADRKMPRALRPYWIRVRASNVGYRLARGAFWSTLGALASQALMLLTSIIIARLLGREQFGQYGIVFSTVGMFTIFAGFGLGTTATKFVAEYRRTDPARAGRIIALSSLVAIGTGFVAAAVLLVIAPWLAATALAAPQLAGLLRLATGIIFFSAIGTAQIGALAGFEAFRAIARINLINGIVTFVLVTGGVVSWGLAGALVGQVTAMGIGCLIATFALRSEARCFGVPLNYAGCGAERSVLATFSLPAVLSGVMVSPVTWACSAILVNQPNGYAEMGIFNAANSWQKAILFLPGCIGSIALPMLSDFYGANERDKYRKALWYNVLLNGGTALVVFLGVSTFSKLIMRSYGVAFEAGYMVLIMLCFSGFLISVGTVIGNAIVSAGRVWFSFVFNGMWGVAYVGLAYLLIPRHGALGLALANVVAYLMHSCWQLVYLKKV